MSLHGTKLTADELIDFYNRHYKDGTFTEIFGAEYSLSELLKVMVPAEIAERIAVYVENSI